MLTGSGPTWQCLPWQQWLHIIFWLLCFSLTLKGAVQWGVCPRVQVRCCTPVRALCQSEIKGGSTMGSVSEGTGKMLHTCVGINNLSVSESVGKMLHTCVSFVSI